MRKVKLSFVLFHDSAFEHTVHALCTLYSIHDAVHSLQFTFLVSFQFFSAPTSTFSSSLHFSFACFLTYLSLALPQLGESACCWNKRWRLLEPVLKLANHELQPRTPQPAQPCLYSAAVEIWIFSCLSVVHEKWS